MKKVISLGLIFLFIIIQAFPQKEAYNWHFGKYSGFEFHGGQPEFQAHAMFTSLGSCSSISDTNGNFLFTTNGENIWNRNKEVMLNGNDLAGSDRTGQGTLIVKKPGSDHLFYVFTACDSNYGSSSGLYFSIIDMTLDNGLGAVTETKNVLLSDAWDASDKIVACKQENSKNIWIITRKFKEDAFAAFLLTPEGLNTEAVLSPANSISHNHVWGNMKVSLDKKYLIAAYHRPQPEVEESQVFEICSFNAITGEIGVLYTIRPGPIGKARDPKGVRVRS